MNNIIDIYSGKKPDSQEASQSMGLWEPNKREPYKYYRNPANPEQIELARTTYKKDVNEYWERIVSGNNRGIAVLGANLGRSFIKYCQLEGNNNINIKPKLEEINKVFENEGRQLIAMLSGFIAEYSVMQNITSNRLYDVYLPQDSDDEVYEEGKGVDLWLDLANGNHEDEKEDESIALAAQVKCAPFKYNALLNHCHLLRSPKDVDRIMRHVIHEGNMRSTSSPYNYDHTRNSLLKMVDYVGRYDNAVASVMLFNTPGSDLDRDDRQIDLSSGEMSLSTSIKVKNEINLIKELYLMSNTFTA